MDMPLKVHDVDHWLHPTRFYKNVVDLQNAGYSLDFASDKMLGQAHTQKGVLRVVAKGAPHKLLLVPSCDKMPVATFKNILRLANEGTAVIFENFPQDVPGFNERQKGQQELKALIAGIKLSTSNNQLQIATMGKGKILVGDVNSALNHLGISPEPLAAKKMKFIRRKTTDGTYYFIVNNTANDLDETIVLQTTARSVLRLDPLNGQINLLPHEQQKNATAVRLQLKSGESLIVKLSNKKEAATPYRYIQTAGEPIDLQNSSWLLKFKEGGPQLPAAKTMTGIRPWTAFTDDSTTRSFSGSAMYTTSFRIKNKAADYMLQLEKLHGSARVIINGKDAGLIWSLPYEMKVGQYLKEGENMIGIEVRNLMANRIRDMDRKGEVWRNYHEINFVNINYKNFDASQWNVQPSGLEGAVRLMPLK
jgi:hypothetical protein